jgi:hypothetical protein
MYVLFYYPQQWRRDDTLWLQRALEFLRGLYGGGYVGLIILKKQILTIKFMSSFFHIILSDYVNRHFYVCDRYERSCAGGWELFHDIKVSQSIMLSYENNKFPLFHVGT